MKTINHVPKPSPTVISSLLHNSQLSNEWTGSPQWLSFLGVVSVLWMPLTFYCICSSSLSHAAYQLFSVSPSMGNTKQDHTKLDPIVQIIWIFQEENQEDQYHNLFIPLNNFFLTNIP